MRSGTKYPLNALRAKAAAFTLLAFTLSVGSAQNSRFAGQAIDDTSLRLPEPGDYGVKLLSPTVIELTSVTAPPAGAAAPVLAGKIKAEDFQVTIGGQPASVARIGFKRRVLYAPLKERDLRVATHVYLELANAIPLEGKPAVQVKHSTDGLWPRDLVFSTNLDPDRFNPALHVNQEGFAPDDPKIAMLGYYLGSLGEMRPPPAAEGFEIIDVKTGKSVFRNRLLARRDVGFTTAPKPYQAIMEANFSAFKTPGEYRLKVPGLGTSYPFHIHEGAWLNLARAYALGLYHQRCGAPNALPFTRFTHAPCHLAPAEVPTPATSYRPAWDIIAKLDDDNDKKGPPVPQLKTERMQHYPFVRTGRIDTAGGHHDAGDYSKYTTNSATLIHMLMFAVDSFPGVASLDNLGLPESGDGVPDLLQEAKWESDFLAKLQDEDGGFYFLVYPKERRYETDVTPDRGDPQIVWPKTTASTAAAVAALAQCASSPVFKQHFPEIAQRYRAQAERGWKYLQTALQRHGQAGAYQKLTHYGDQFQHDDELAWAACELFLATGDAAYHDWLRASYPNPADPKTHQWMWWRAAFSYGCAQRSYAFAARSGRLKPAQLDAEYLAKCEGELRRAGDDVLRASQQNGYGTSYPEASKRQGGAGWYFASEQTFDLTVAYQLRDRPEYLDAVLLNLNFELGCNPNNVSFLTGMGLRRQREIVHQFAQNDARVLPPIGIPLGSLQSGYQYIGHYKNELRQLSIPADDAKIGPYPLYDRWADSFNVTTEFVINNQARSLASVAFWTAQSKAKAEPSKPIQATIALSAKSVAPLQPVTARLEAPGVKLAGARILWEGRDHEPTWGETFTFTPRNAGPQWIEAEAHWPDGRRVFAQAAFAADSPVVFWVEGALPKGATATKNGGDDWTWIKPSSRPAEFASRPSAQQHQSALVHGIHEHGFERAQATLHVERGDVLFAYVFLDPKNPPKTIMLEYSDGKTNDHRAFWGSNLIPYGTINTASQRHMGPLPALGKWTRLEIPASAIALEGVEVKGMVFRLHSGRVTWDAAGKMSPEGKAKGFTAGLQRP